jgi:sulfur carrier protein
LSVPVRLNGKDESVEAETVLALLTSMGIDPQRRGIAVAINGEVVSRRTWSDHRLAAADDIEIVRPLQGG